ncbi:hypothetical protein FACS1894102_5200 [Spirochaetia bacterium]|nr:hypothetical protein FACS1894102_5200 [Spirochaetia bacterium]
MKFSKIWGCAFIIVISSLFTGSGQLSAYLVHYKEQYYKLYHLHYIQYPDDTMENIYWLEKALKADFCNPLYANALIENETQWEKYRYLFMMHLNLKLIEQHIYLGNKWNKRNAYFYNAPFKEQNLDSIKTAETCYQAALSYWPAAKEWAEKALEKRFKFINLDRVGFWQDEAFRIENGELNYDRILGKELARLQDVREKFEAMDENTY